MYNEISQKEFIKKFHHLDIITEDITFKGRYCTHTQIIRNTKRMVCKKVSDMWASEQTKYFEYVK